MEKKGEYKLRILETCGSQGLPSCGETDAGKIGQGEGGTVYIGGSYEKISPGTPRWLFPIFLLHLYTPERLSKSPRNMERHKSKHHK